MITTGQSKIDSATAPAVPQFRTMVVEDHRPFLDCVRAALRGESHIEIVGEAQDGMQAVARAKALQPDLIILDIGLRGLNGLQAAHRIRGIVLKPQSSSSPQESSPDIVHEALSLGACGCVLKAYAARELPLALHAVMSGKRFVGHGLDRNMSKVV